VKPKVISKEAADKEEEARAQYIARLMELEEEENKAIENGECKSCYLTIN
jgi:hypothetical protein